MKKTIKGALCFVAMLSCHAVSGQVSTASNVGVAGDYVGWAAAVLNDLNIQHLGNYQLVFSNNAFTRMIVRNGGNATNEGRILIGNDLGAGFNPAERLHLHQNAASTVGIKFTHATTGTGGGSGTTIGVFADESFKIDQWEAQNIELRNLDGGSMRERLFVIPTGQVLVGSLTLASVPIDQNPITSFSASRSSLLNVRGPINSCYTMSSLASKPTILYGYTDPFGTATPSGDGFRMHMNFSNLSNNYDALVFEKTDDNHADPTGYITFTNTGSDNVEEISAYIHGSGRSYFGKNVISLGNRVTIDSDPTDATPSGLRLVDLPSTSPTVTNPGTGVLSVDGSGNVIYVPVSNGSTGNGFFLCSDGSGAANLSGNSKVNLNNHNLYFEKSDQYDVNHVGIGFSCDALLPGKLSVLQKHTSLANAGTTAVYAHNIDAGEITDLTFTGVEGRADGNQSTDAQTNRGGFFSAANSRNTRGVEVKLEASTENDNEAYGGYFNVDTEADDNVGVVGTATGSLERNVGGAFLATGIDNTNTSIGVYGKATGGTVVNRGVWGVAPIGTNSYAGYFDGDVFCTSGAWSPSDKRLKENIAAYTGASDVLSQLRPVSYNFKTREFPQMNLERTPQIGLISQELESVLPQFVRETTNPAVYNEKGEIVHPEVTFKAVSYEKFIPVLIGGHQEQEAKVEALQAENAALKNQLDELNAKFARLESCLQNMLPGLCETSQGAIEQNSPEVQHTIAVNLSNKHAVVLNQNVPNPFAESTVITYSVPAMVKQAQIHFYDASGKLLQSVEITERGNGKLQVFGNDLSSGTYVYTLVADDEVITKRLVKE